MEKIRESNFELLRLVAMFFIVWYHLLLKFIVDIDNTPIFKSMYLPLHVAVICFVLISGYFHIKPSLRGGGKLLFPLLIYYVPLTLYEIVCNDMAIGNLMFFSKTPYWFIRTYFYLFLIAPVINSFISNNKSRIYLLTILLFMAVYMGWLMHDRSMDDGKNLVLFIFVYVIGDSLRHYQKEIDKINSVLLLVIYLLLNVLLVFLYNMYSGSFIVDTVWALSYPYNSPVLIFNAILLFLLFGRLHLRSRIVNWLASSVFAVYILHHQHFVLYKLIGPITLSLYGVHSSSIVLLLQLALFALVIMFICIFIDKLFEPLQNKFIQCFARWENNSIDYKKDIFRNHNISVKK